MANPLHPSTTQTTAVGNGHNVEKGTDLGGAPFSGYRSAGRASLCTRS